MGGNGEEFHPFLPASAAIYRAILEQVVKVVQEKQGPPIYLSPSQEAQQVQRWLASLKEVTKSNAA